jgi:hypothetical protein
LEIKYAHIRIMKTSRMAWVKRLVTAQTTINLGLKKSQTRIFGLSEHKIQFSWFRWKNKININIKQKNRTLVNKDLGQRRKKTRLHCWNSYASDILRVISRLFYFVYTKFRLPAVNRNVRLLYQREFFWNTWAECHVSEGLHLNTVIYSAFI